MTNSANDQRFMALALALGRRGQGRCWPNPAVGAVLVQGDRIVGRGWTQPGGRPHAETVALAQAGAAAKGATAYVTLEPCAHYGRTGPCAQALIDAGVARVVTAIADPDPRVSGQGHDMLRDAGVLVKTGLLATAARRDLAGYLSRTTQARPFVTLKLALTLDGRIATATGESQWITGPLARRFGHAMRLRHDAVLVGGETARIDDPDLRVRDMGVVQQPVRIVASRNAHVPQDGKLARTAQDAPVWILYDGATNKLDDAAKDHWKFASVRLVPIADIHQGQLAPDAMMAALAEAGLTRIYCEGGGALASSLIAADQVDELVVFQAGLVLGAEAKPGLGALGVDRLAEANRFELSDLHRVGPDTVQIWRRKRCDLTD